MSAERSEVDPLVMPRYSYADADYLSAVGRGTSKRLTSGYHYRTKTGKTIVQPPVVTGIEMHRAVSFHDLLDLAAISQLKKRGFSLNAIREIVRNCQEILGVERPFATLKFKTGGREIFVDLGSHLVEVGRKKRELAWKEILEPFLTNLDYNAEGLATRWWPMGRDIPVMVDPSYGFGLPVVSTSGVRTEIIVERFRAGEDSREIAEDFGIQPSDVENALRFELLRAAA